MGDPEIIKDKDWPGIVREIKESEQSEVEKLAYAFAWITGRIVDRARDDIEFARALKDEEALVKQQIKMETARHVRAIFQECYRLATGRRAWDE